MAGGAIELGDARDRGRAQQGHPDAVRAERLLRGEVVGVGLRRVQRQPARTRGGVDQDQGITGLEGPFDAHHDSGRGLVVGPRQRVRRRVGDGLGRVAGLGLDDDRVVEEGAAPVTFPNLAENSP